MVIFLLIIPSLSFGTEKIPYSVHLIIYKAQILMNEKKYSKAIALLKKFRKKGYSNYLIDFTLGNCFFMINKYDEAKRYYLCAVRKKANFYKGWLNLAQSYYQLKDYINAANAFIKAYNCKKDPECLYYAGICFLSAKKPAKALSVLKKLTKRKNMKLEWKEAIAHAYISCNRPKDALPFVEDIIRAAKEKKRMQWQEVKIHLYVSMGMNKEAINYLRMLIKEDPVQERWWKDLSLIYLKENLYRDALVTLIIKGFLSPLTVQEKKIAAQLSMLLGIPRRALDLYKEILKKTPESEIIYNTALCYIRLHRLNEALKFINKWSKKGFDKKLLMLKAEILYQLRRYNDAGRIFEKIAKKGINPGKAWLMAGYSFWNAKAYSSACQAFQKAMRYPKQRPYALKALKHCSSL